MTRLPERDCCIDVGQDWRDSPCLCMCHYPRVLSRTMLDNRERYDVQEPLLAPVDTSTYVAEPGVPARAHAVDTDA